MLQRLNEEQILLLGKNLDSWVSADSYSTMIAGWHWREGTFPGAQILTWLKSENLWFRRVAVVSTISLNLRSKGGLGDTKRTLMICEKVVDDCNDLIAKALSWALRELAKNDKSAVEDFLDKCCNRLHFRVFREVSAKLRTGRNNG